MAGRTLDRHDRADVIASARAGNDRAFEQLVADTYSDTYTLALRLTGDDHDARDVVQEAYLRAYRSLDRFRGDSRFETWLYRITANCASTHLGRRSRHRHDELTEDTPVLDERTEANPVGRAENGELRQSLTGALAELSPKLRSVVVLRDIYDLTHEDIADELGISVSAAKVRLHRARRRLREDLFEGDAPVAPRRQERARAV